MNKLQDFNQSFRSMRLITLLSLSGFIAATVAYAVLYHQLEEEYRQRTYVITSWGTFPASYYDGRKVRA